jgi:hypothetical protein
MHRNAGKAVSTVVRWSRYTHPNPPTNLAIKSRTETAQDSGGGSARRRWPDAL